MDFDNDTPSSDEEKDTKPRFKDSWDKANIVLKPIGGIITAITIVILGYYTSSFLEKQKENENDVRLYTQLMSERERAEQSLRTTMFKEIFDRVLTQPSKTESESGENDKLRLKKDLMTIRTHVVGIDLISRNFHEFLDMKPLFTHIMWEIVVKRGEIKNEKNYSQKECQSVGENWNEASPCQELKWQQIRLGKIARRVASKQFNILAENGDTTEIEIYLKDLCTEKNMRTFRPPDPSCQKPGFNEKRVLSLKFKKCRREASFEISIDRAYPPWNMVQVKIRGSVSNSSGMGCSDFFKGKNEEIEPKEFWVGSFDFPMIDHSYISAHEKYAVVLDKIDRKEGVVKLQLVYFPASDAGLQEKSYYQQKLLEKLISQSELFAPTPKK